MKKRNIYIYALIVLISLSACGFKKISSLEKKSYFINKINISGDKRIGQIMKSEILLSSSESGEIRLNLGLEIKQKQEIKEKNIAGKISKYNMVININLSIESLEGLEKINNKLFSKSLDYNVGNSHSDTISNKKNTTKNLTEALTEEIISFIKIYVSK